MGIGSRRVLPASSSVNAQYSNCKAPVSRPQTFIGAEQVVQLSGLQLMQMRNTSAHALLPSGFDKIIADAAAPLAMEA